MSKDTELAEVGPWAEQKLAALAAYLEFYTTVLKNQHWCKTIYLDAFAGGGARTFGRRQRAHPKRCPCGTSLHSRSSPISYSEALAAHLR